MTAQHAAKAACWVPGGWICWDQGMRQSVWHEKTILRNSKKFALVANAIQNLKAHSSRWMKEDVPNFAWQEGYGAFSVSESHRPTVLDYLATQSEHHRKWSYEQEFVALVRKSGVEYDPGYLFG